METGNSQTFIKIIEKPSFLLGFVRFLSVFSILFCIFGSSKKATTTQHLMPWALRMGIGLRASGFQNEIWQLSFVARRKGCFKVNLSAAASPDLISK